LYQEYFVALDDTGAVRGAYILKHQKFLVNGQVISVGDYQLPMSEGIIDRTYNMVGLNLMTDALRRQPVMYALGMGGLDRPLPKFLKAMRWQLVEVPFYFYINHAFAFLRNIKVLRRSALRKLALDLLAFSGMGPAAIKLKMMTKRERIEDKLSASTVSGYGDWVDNIWNEKTDPPTFSAVRDTTTLNILYPESDKKFIRLRFDNDNEPVAWAVLLDTQMSDHKQFGKMRVGTIVDCYSRTGYERETISQSCQYLKEQGVDLIVSNQASARWGEAMTASGFMRGPSNFIFAASPALIKTLGENGLNLARMHLNRGDGDGPINL